MPGVHASTALVFMDLLLRKCRRSRSAYHPTMASTGLTKCSRDASAAKPSDWRLMGVACRPREVDPKVHSADEWCAWAARSEQGTAGGQRQTLRPPGLGIRRSRHG